MGRSNTVAVSVSLNPTSLDMTVHPGSGPAMMQNVTGFLRDDKGAGIQGADVQLWKGLSGKEPTLYGVYMTTADGGYGFFGIPVVDGTYLFEAVFMGGLGYSGSSVSKSVTFGKAQTSFRALVVDPTSGGPPLEVSISTKLSRVDTSVGLGGYPVDLFRNDVLIASKFTDIGPTGGEVSFTDEILTAGTFKYYVYFAGDEWFHGCKVYDGSVTDGNGDTSMLGLVVIALLAMSEE